MPSDEVTGTSPRAWAAGRNGPLPRLDASVWKIRAVLRSKAMETAGEISQPQPGLVAADFALRGFTVCQQAVMPEPAGARVMLAPGFDVMHFETAAFEIGRRHADMVKLAAGEDVTRERDRLRPLPAKAFSIRLGRARDGVMQIKALRSAAGG